LGTPPGEAGIIQSTRPAVNSASNNLTIKKPAHAGFAKS